MNNLFHKIVVTSVCTALGLALGVNKEAKAATFIFSWSTMTSIVVDADSTISGIEGSKFDGLGDVS